MKNAHLLFTGLCLFLLGACSGKDTPEKLVLSQNSFELYAGDEITFRANRSVQVTSENTFIAYATEAENENDKYVLKGLHVGETTVTISTDSESIICPVKVIPRYDTFIEPAYSLLKKPLASLDELFAVDTREIMKQDDSKIFLYGEKPGVEEVSYTFKFEDNKYVVLGASIKLSMKKKDVLNFISERYNIIDENSEFTYYSNPDRNYYVISLLITDESAELHYF